MADERQVRARSAVRRLGHERAYDEARRRVAVAAARLTLSEGGAAYAAAADAARALSYAAADLVEVAYYAAQAAAGTLAPDPNALALERAVQAREAEVRRAAAADAAWAELTRLGARPRPVTSTALTFHGPWQRRRVTRPTTFPNASRFHGG
jgi:hypothetical protein